MVRRAPFLLVFVLGCSSASTTDTDAATEPDALIDANAHPDADPDAAPTADAAPDADAGPDADRDAAEDADAASDADADAPSEKILWPLSASPLADADTVRAQYGPRWIGRYDFHGGIDLAAPIGTKVHAVASGKVVDVGDWDGTSVGAGTFVLVEHAGARFTAYLHLSKRVKNGTVLAAGDVVGEVGETGATYPHLHLTYMVGLTTSIDERKSRNPLELLPHGAAPKASVTSWGAEVVLSIPVQVMKVRNVRLYGGGKERTLDYYAVVAKGSTARDAHVHFGTWIGAGAAKSGFFPLTVAPDPRDFVPTRVVLESFDGAVLLDAKK